MKRILSLGLCLAMVAAAGMAFAATNGVTQRDFNDLHLTVWDDSVIMTSEGSSNMARRVAGPDTFLLYGHDGTGSVLDHANEGTFQDANGVIPDAQGWTGWDLTDQPVYWHISTYNAENLNSHGAGNKAYWCGVETAEGFVNLPGYGNGWNDVLIYKSGAVADPSVGQTVTLDFYYNHETESGYDYFYAEYDSAGTWVELLKKDATNHVGGVFAAPGLTYAATNNGHGIVFDGNGYGGDNLDEVVIRLRVFSDGAWSDQDGLNPTVAGAAQVDDIAVSSTVESFVQDNEDAGVNNKFVPDKAPFAGDFSALYAQFTDIDPCVENTSPTFGFIDSNQIIPNGPGLTGLTQTGGSTSTNWSYGIPGNWVVNYEGGLSEGETSCSNWMLSPAIPWDPGVAIGGDVNEVVGAYYQWSVYRHLPLENYIFYVWGVRSKTATGDWSPWEDRGFVYYGGGVAGWTNHGETVTDLLVSNPATIQLSLGMIDYGWLLPDGGDDATPSPVFDNVMFKRYRIGGPIMTTRTIDLANDQFPVSGLIDASTEAARDKLDTPFAMVRDVSTGDLNIIPGDSIIVDVTSNIPGATVTDIRMKWALKTNSYFETTIRDAVFGTLDENVVTGAAGTVWTGEVVADSSYTSNGFIVDDRYFFDLPDSNFMYPGDELHFYIQSTDSGGRVTTYPSDTTGFGLFDGTYARRFMIRGLPTITASGQPDLLVWNDFGHRGAEAEYLNAFGSIGMAETVDYDTYTTKGPSSGVANGLGSGGGGHGATAAQLAGYSSIFYFSGNLSGYTLGDGDPNLTKANDQALLIAWSALPGDRSIAYFGDYVVSALGASTYATTQMGVQLNDVDVSDDIGNQTAPVVRATGAALPASALPMPFVTEFVAYGGCGSINQFDNIEPLAGAAAGHGYVNPATDAIIAGPAASVVYERFDGLDRKLDITFPYGQSYVYNVASRAAVNLTSRATLFEEILSLFNVTTGGSPITDAPQVRKAELSVAPNPFNPSTTVKFANVLGQKGTVKVFNLRGELVSTLHSGEYTTEQFQWDGTDRRGATVASGVYVIQATAGSQKLTTKAALVK